MIYKTVSTEYTPGDLGGGTMICTLNISLSTPPPPHNPGDPYDAPGYPTEDPIRMESILNCSTNLNVKSVLGDAQTNNTINMRISGVKVTDINY